MQIANKKALLEGLLSFVKQNNFLCTKLIIFECDDSNSDQSVTKGMSAM